MAASTSNNEGGACYPPINAELYRLLVTGDVDWMTADTIEQVSVLELRCARDINNVLHIAASSGQVVLVNEILRHWPDLMYKKNSHGDLPFHSAIKAGKLESVDALTDWIKTMNTTDRVLRWINRGGNTALHIALEYDQVRRAGELVNLYPQALYVMNNEGICPLYMAIKKELVDLVKHMVEKLQACEDHAIVDHLMKGLSVLHAAVSAQSTEMLKHLLIYDGGRKLINLVDKEGWTALSYAAFMGYLEKVEIIAENVPDSAFTCNMDGSFPIHHAVLGGQVSVVSLLSSSRFVLNARGQNIIHLATLTADSQLVSHLLSSLPEGHSLINQKDEDGNTPLHLATKAKHVEVVETLINNEHVDVKLSNKEGLAANDLAMKLKYVKEDEDVVQRLNFLLERANSNHKCCEIDDKMYRLLVSGEIDQVIDRASHRSCELTDLVSLEDGNNVLHIAACIGDTQLIQDLLVRHNCITLMYQANKTGDLPIHSAVKASKLQSLQDLFQWSATIPSDHICKRQNFDGNTALHIAVLYNHRDSANYLYEQCPQAAYCLNKDNICPLFLAIEIWSTCENKLIQQMIGGLQGNLQVQNHLKGAESIVHVAILVRSRAILESIINRALGLLDSVDNFGRSPLSYAALSGHVAGVELLLKECPDLEFKRDKDKDGSFPIHYAVKGGFVKVIKLFRPMCLLNTKGQNIVHVAADNDKIGAISKVGLLKYEELINTSDDDGNTPLHLAVKGFHLLAVYRLLNYQHINGNLKNKELLTPLDIFIMHMKYPDEKGLSSLQIRLMDLMLNNINGKTALSRARRDGQEDKEKLRELKAAKLYASKNKASSSNESTNKERANILLVVATLIITVTFAAGFNPPGGYSEQTGALNLLSHKNFRHFVTYNSVALDFGIASALILILGMNIKGLAEISLIWGGYFILLGLFYIMLSFSYVLMLYTAKKESQTTSGTNKSIKEIMGDGRQLILSILFPVGVPIMFWACSKFKLTLRLYLELFLVLAPYTVG